MEIDTRYTMDDVEYIREWVWPGSDETSPLCASHTVVRINGYVYFSCMEEDQ